MAMRRKHNPTLGFRPGVSFPGLLTQTEADGVVVEPDDYTLTIESVSVVKEGTALRPLCRVVGGPENGTLVCCGMYEFSGSKLGAAMRDIKAWGITESQISNAADLGELAQLLVGRTGEVELAVYPSPTAGEVNTHKPGAVKLTSPLATNHTHTAA